MRSGRGRRLPALLLLVALAAAASLVAKRRRPASPGQAPPQASAPEPGTNEIIDTATAAELLSQPESQIDVLVADGLLTPVGGAKPWRFQAAEVRALRMAGG